VSGNPVLVPAARDAVKEMGTAALAPQRRTGGGDYSDRRELRFKKMTGGETQKWKNRTRLKALATRGAQSPNKN